VFHVLEVLGKRSKYPRKKKKNRQMTEKIWKSKNFNIYLKENRYILLPVRIDFAMHGKI